MVFEMFAALICGDYTRENKFTHIRSICGITRFWLTVELKHVEDVDVVLI